MFLFNATLTKIAFCIRWYEEYSSDNPKFATSLKLSGKRFVMTGRIDKLKPG
jgi:hypothetical protein